MDSMCQLLHPKGLGKIICRPKLLCFQPICELIKGGHDDGGTPGLFVSQKIKAVSIGKLPVETHDVKPGAA
jgi:hypothetical protein